MSSKKIDEFEKKFSEATSPEEIEELFEEVVFYFLNEASEDVLEKIDLLTLVQKICPKLISFYNPCYDAYENYEDTFDDDFGWDTK